MVDLVTLQESRRGRAMQEIRDRISLAVAAEAGMAEAACRRPRRKDKHSLRVDASKCMKRSDGGTCKKLPTHHATIAMAWVLEARRMGV